MFSRKTDFKKFATINTKTDNYWITIKIDNDDNIFIINNSEIYKCLKEKNTFQKIWNFNEHLWSITINKNNNIYIGIETGKLYECWARENDFSFSEVEDFQWRLL